MRLRASSSSALYFSASCTMRSISSFDKRPLSLVMVILFFWPAWHRTQGFQAANQHERGSTCWGQAAFWMDRLNLRNNLHATRDQTPK